MHLPLPYHINFVITEVKYYRDCQEALDKGVVCSGVYTIKPDHLPPFEASDNIIITTNNIPQLN